MKVELLYFEGCPSYEALRPRLEQMLADRGLREKLELVKITTVEEAEAKRFLGSPSVRVEGHDVEPVADDRTDFGMKCRIYPSTEELRHTPTDEIIVAALDRAR